MDRPERSAPIRGWAKRLAARIDRWAERTPWAEKVAFLVFVVVLGILSAIAIPQFAIPRTRRNEAYLLSMQRQLTALASLQRSHYAQTRTFASDLIPTLPEGGIESGVSITITEASRVRWEAFATHARMQEWCRISGDTLRTLGPICGRGPVLAVVPPSNAVDSSVQQLPWAGSAFNTPETMLLDQTEVVVFVLDPTKVPRVSPMGVRLPPAEAESLIATVVEVAGPAVPVETRPLRYAERMVARLEGQAFEITPAGDQLQAVSGTEVTEWTWEVTPRRTGRQILQLTVDALLLVAGRETPKRFRVLRKEIVVRVHWPRAIAGFVVDNWQWFAGGSAATMLTLIATWWRRRRRRPIGFRG